MLTSLDLNATDAWEVLKYCLNTSFKSTGSGFVSLYHAHFLLMQFYVVSSVFMSPLMVMIA